MLCGPVTGSHTEEILHRMANENIDGHDDINAEHQSVEEMLAYDAAESLRYLRLGLSPSYHLAKASYSTVKLWFRACFADMPEGAWLAGLFEEYEQKRENSVVELYERAANLDYNPARYSLGSCYMRGYGVDKDISHSLEIWMSLAYSGREHFVNLA